MDRFQPSNSKFSSEDPRLVELTYELTQLLESGQAFDLESFVGQHPQYADELRRIYSAIRAMVALAGTDSEHLAGHKGQEEHPIGPLGDFLLIRPIGRGGMGVVYEAEQMSLARRVAVKILPFASLWTESALERFRNEVRIAAMLEHPNIVPIYGMGCERGVHFYAMKLVDGCSLSDVLGQRKLQTAEHSAESSSADPNPGSAVDTVVAVTTAVMGDDNWYHTVARLSKEAATALAFAHQQAVIHRDIKPSNLLLDRQGRLFVADFGLARFESDVSLTRTGDLLGTPRYMSPEQASGSSKQLDPRTDIYSLGATLYELLTLRPVISGPSRAAAIRQLQDLQVAAPRTHDANIPQPLDQIVLKCLQPDPSDRYTTAAALVEDLGRFVAGEPVLARAPSVVRRTTRWIQRHPQTTLGLLTVLVFCSLISTASFWMTHQGWLGSSPQRGPPGENLVESDNLTTTIPPNFQSPEESPDMLRASRNNRNGKNNKAINNRPLGVEKLEGRELMAQLAFGTPMNMGPSVNSAAVEESPTITGDGLSLFFSRQSAPYYSAIFEATRATTDVPFGNATSAGPEVNFDIATSHPAVSQDGLTIVYSVGSGPQRLYQATRASRNQPFSPAQSLGDLVGNQDLTTPSLSADGLTLYFAAFDTAHTKPSIYQATRNNVGDPWDNVAMLGPEINAGGAGSPSISTNGLTLFFTSGGLPGGFGNSDLYVSTRVDLGAPWGAAVNLGPQVNTPYNDRAPSVSADGTVLYFHSNRPGGFGSDDLYKVAISGTATDTKFYVVDDASTDRTYEYQADGIATDGYQLTLGNTQPRGAASTIAGDKVWVVDANKKVYVYNNSGTLQGTGWSAGSLQSSSTAGLQGITTNGSDVWLVEDTFSSNKNDKIYRYKDAASRISGSQNMFSSFSLNSANRNATDLVTDGSSIWVLNNTSTTDSVFKYAVGGTLLSSWTITGGGGSPTGITLDPSNSTMDMWIVDNSTDRVYRLPGARNTDASSVAASDSFVLASLNNINPQGIADPPPPNSDLSNESLAQDGDNTRSVDAIKRGFMQAPIVSFGLLSTERVTSLQSSVEKTESVDETMSRTIGVLPIAPIAVAKSPLMPLSSPSRIAMERSIDLVFADVEFSDSLRAIAKDLLESSLR